MPTKSSFLQFIFILLFFSYSISAFGQKDTLKPYLPHPNDTCLLNTIIVREIIDSQTCCTRITVYAPPFCIIELKKFHTTSQSAIFFIDGFKCFNEKHFYDTIQAGDSISFELCLSDYDRELK